MIKQHAVMVYPALALLVIGQQAPAQLVSKLEAGAIVANRDGGVMQEDIFSVTPSLRYERPNYRVSASGSAWRVGQAWQLAGGEAAGSLVSPRLFGMQGEVTARASRIFYDATATAERLDALARVHMLLQDRGGFWVGGGVDRPWRVAVASTIDVSAGGAWTRLGPATLSGSVTNFFFSKVTAPRDSTGQPVACGAGEEELHTPGPGAAATVLPSPAARSAPAATECRRQSRFSDVQAGVQWAHDAIELAASAGYRLGDSYDVTPESRRWASAVATFWITNQLAAVAGAGRQPASPAHGLPARSYANFGMMLAYWPIPRRTVPVAPRASVAAFSVLSTEEGSSGERTIVVRAGGIERLEVMGSFTGWEPRALTRFGRDHWELTLPINAGLHEINIRTDGGKWRPPPGLPTRQDGFNGEVGILVIE